MTSDPSNRRALRTVLLLCGGSVAAAVIVVLAAYVVNGSRTPPEAPAAVRESPDMRRLFAHNAAADDAARSIIFRRALETSGQRCDAVDAAIMLEAGRWRVRCAPGYTYVFRFDGDGRFLGASRLLD